MNRTRNILPYEAGTIIKDVLVGTKGNLFLFQGGHRQFDNLLGKIRPSSLSIENFSGNIYERKSYCNEMGILYRHIVFPCKPMVKNRFLTEEYSSIESLFEINYKKSITGDSEDVVLYPLQLLKELEQSNVSTFKKYDTHMTDIANLEVAKLLSNIVSSSSRPEWTSIEEEVGGDLSKMIGEPCKNTELKLVPNNFEASYFGNRNFLPSNGNEIVIAKRLNSEGLPRLLIFGDSFFKDMIPFLSGFFSTIVYFRSQFFHKDIVELIRPDVVFTGNAERYLHKVNSDDSAGSLLFDLYGISGYSPDFKFLYTLKTELSYHYYPSEYKKRSDHFVNENILFQGRLESFDGKVLTGWCIDSTVKIPKIDVIKNGVFYKRIECNRERSDVIKKFGQVNTLNGFSFSVEGFNPGTFEFFVSGKNVKLIPTQSFEL